jgi:hypothetical protein
MSTGRAIIMSVLALALLACPGLPTGPPSAATKALKSAVWIRSGSAAPFERVDAALAYDPDRQRLVMFGGFIEPNGASADMQEWDGTQWTQVGVDGTAPPPRSCGGMAYDSLHHQMVLFGGEGPTGDVGYLNDTWTWDGTTWTQMHPMISPTARCAPLVFDSLRGRVVLFGGEAATNTVFFGDTWEWDGSQWTLAMPVASPGERSLHGLAFDSARNRTVLFGGYLYNGSMDESFNDTWEYDGTTWTRRFSPVNPSARWAHGMAFDADLGVTIVFGGYSPNGTVYDTADTWAWDGNEWASLTTGPAPPADADFALAFDAAPAALILFGGLTTNDSETWMLVRR